MKQRGKKKSLASSAAADFFLDSLLASYGVLTPSGCVYAANPSPLPGIRLKPELQLPAPACPGGWTDKPLGLVSAGLHQSSVRESLHFALRTPVAALSSMALKLPPTATRSLCPRRGFLLCGNLSSFTAPSHWCMSRPYSFVSVISFFLLPFPSTWGVSCLWGGLTSSASVQWVFCRSSSTCRCISNVSVGRKVISMSYSSTILPRPPESSPLFSW